MNLDRRYLSLKEEHPKKWKKITGLACKVNGCKINTGINWINKKPDYCSIEYEGAIPIKSIQKAIGDFGKKNRQYFEIDIESKNPCFHLLVKKKPRLKVYYTSRPNDEEALEKARTLLKKLNCNFSYKYDYNAERKEGKIKKFKLKKNPFDSLTLMNFIEEVKRNKNLNFDFKFNKFNPDNEISQRRTEYQFTNNAFLMKRAKRVSLFWKKGELEWWEVERVISDFMDAKKIELKETHFKPAYKKLIFKKKQEEIEEINLPEDEPEYSSGGTISEV